MPEPVEPSPLTDHEEAKWRAEFKRRGREVVYEQARRDQFNPEKIERLAYQWLREQEAAAEWRKRATFWIAIAALVISISGFVVTCAMVLGSSRPQLTAGVRCPEISLAAKSLRRVNGRRVL
jgi:hypothetical protein